MFIALYIITALLIAFLFVINDTSNMKPITKLIICLLTIASCSLLICNYKVNTTTVVEAENSSVLKTVAHIDLSNRKDLELITKDYANDIAFYKYINPNYNIAVGDKIRFVDNTEATLVSVDAIGFTVRPESIVPAGMSGTAVLSNDIQIGIISMRMEDGTIRCVWS